MSDLYNKIKKNVLASKDADAINQLDVMEGKKSSGKGHFDTKEGSVRHVYVTKENVPKSQVSTFLERRKALGSFKSLPGAIGKGVALGVLGVEAASEGLKKLRSMEGRDAEPEITSEVEGKSKGGSIMARGNKLARMKPTKMY